MQFLSSPSTPSRMSSSTSSTLPSTPSRAILFPTVLERQSSNILRGGIDSEKKVVVVGTKRVHEGGDTPKQSKRGNYQTDQNQSDDAKAQQQSTPQSSSKASNNVTNLAPPSSPSMHNSSLQDRFIPNRSCLDVDYNYYLLTKIEESSEITTTTTTSNTAASDLRSTPGQRKLKEELSNIKSPDRKRVVECRQSLTPTFDRVARNSLQEQMQVYNTYFFFFSFLMFFL